MSETKFSYNKQDLASGVNERKPVADGKWVKVVVGKVDILTAPAKCGVGEDQILRPRLDILDPKDGTTRLPGAPSFFHRMTMPIRQDDVPEYKAPDYAASFWGEFCRAFLDDRHPAEPRPDSAGKLVFKGKKYDKTDLPSIRDEMKDALGQEAVTQLNGKGQDLLRCVAYCKTKIAEGGFLNASKLCAQLPKDAKLATVQELFAAEAPKAGAQAKKGGGKK